MTAIRVAAPHRVAHRAAAALRDGVDLAGRERANFTFLGSGLRNVRLLPGGTTQDTRGRRNVSGAGEWPLRPSPDCTAERDRLNAAAGRRI